MYASGWYVGTERLGHVQRAIWNSQKNWVCATTPPNPLPANLQASWSTYRCYGIPKKISSGRKEQAFHLLWEEGWKIERVALASGVSMQSIERWEVNYAVHGCVKPFKSTRGRPRLLTGDMIDDIRRLLREDPVFLTRLRNGLLSTTTSPSRLWLCIWTYGISHSLINISSALQPNGMMPIAQNGF